MADGSAASNNSLLPPPAGLFSFPIEGRDGGCQNSASSMPTDPEAIAPDLQVCVSSSLSLWERKGLK